LWEEYKLKDQAIKIKFNEPTSFMAMRNQQLMQLKFDNYNTATQGDGISKSYAQKYYLNMSSEQMKENREWQRKDAALIWELEQIKGQGPNFREQLASQQGSAGEEGSGAPPEMGGGGGAPGASEIPAFGGGESGETEGAEGGDVSVPEIPVETGGTSPADTSAPAPPTEPPPV
jgi:hypothetical protein